MNALLKENYSKEPIMASETKVTRSPSYKKNPGISQRKTVEKMLKKGTVPGKRDPSHKEFGFPKPTPGYAGQTG